MATYSNLMSSVDSVFAAEEWASTLIPTYPANFYPSKLPDEFIKYEIIPANEGEKEYGKASYKSGLIILQIYTSANKGPKRLYELASVIEEQFEKRSIGSTQVLGGTLSIVGIDKDDTSLFRADYSLKFNSF